MKLLIMSTPSQTTLPPLLEHHLVRGAKFDFSAADGLAYAVIFSQVRLFITFIMLFVIASALCRLTPSGEIMIAACIIQGAIVGLMIALSQSLILSSYLPEKSGMTFTFWGMTMLASPIMGPLLGVCIYHHSDAVQRERRFLHADSPEFDSRLGDGDVLHSPHHAQLAKYTGLHNPAFAQAVEKLMVQGMSKQAA